MSIATQRRKEFVRVRLADVRSELYSMLQDRREILSRRERTCDYGRMFRSDILEQVALIRAMESYLEEGK